MRFNARIIYGRHNSNRHADVNIRRLRDLRDLFFEWMFLCSRGEVNMQVYHVYEGVYML